MCLPDCIIQAGDPRIGVAFVLMLSRALYSILNFPFYFAYIGIFVMMVFMGEELLLIIGALSRLHLLNFWAGFFMAFLGTVAGDIFWYKLGEKYGKDFAERYGRWFFLTPERFRKLKERINHRGGIFIFLSKFMYNMNHISEAAAGAVRFNFKKYLRYQIPVSAVWTFAFINLGYFFADNLDSLKHDVALFTILILAIFVAFILLDRLVEKLIEKRWFKFINGNGK